jgi:hypothetical protein
MKDFGDTSQALAGALPAEQTQFSPAQSEGYGLPATKAPEKNVQLAFNPLGGQNPDEMMTFGDPNRRIPDYPGGRGDVSPNTLDGPAGGEYSKFLSDLYTKTYSRASENILAASLPLKEVDPGLRQQVKKWELLGDSELYTLRPELGNRNLQPTADKQAGSAQNPGHMYAFGMDQDGMPVTVLDYYRDPRGGIHYGRQWQMRISQPDAKGALTIDVTEYKQSEPQDVGPRLPAVNGLQQTLVGNTRYYERPSADGQSFVPTKIEQYNGFEQTKPALVVAFSSEGVSFQRKQPNGILQPEPTLSGSAAQQKLKELAPNFKFFNLYGPSREILK